MMKKGIFILVAAFCVILGLDEPGLADQRDLMDARSHQSMINVYQSEKRQYNLTNKDPYDGYNRYLDNQIQREQRMMNESLMRHGLRPLQRDMMR